MELAPRGLTVHLPNVKHLTQHRPLVTQETEAGQERRPHERHLAAQVYHKGEWLTLPGSLERVRGGDIFRLLLNDGTPEVDAEAIVDGMRYTNVRGYLALDHGYVNETFTASIVCEPAAGFYDTKAPLRVAKPYPDEALLKVENPVEDAGPPGVFPEGSTTEMVELWPPSPHPRRTDRLPPSAPATVTVEDAGVELTVTPTTEGQE
jgi:hypothetical protein